MLQVFARRAAPSAGTFYKRCFFWMAHLLCVLSGFEQIDALFKKSLLVHPAVVALKNKKPRSILRGLLYFSVPGIKKVI